MAMIVQLIEAVAWPIAAVWLGYLFHGDVRSLLSRISHVKYGDAEATFEVGVEDIGARIPQLPSPQKTAYIEPLNKREESLLTLAQTSPRAAILEAWLEVERELAAAAGRLNLPLTDLADVLRTDPGMAKFVPTFEHLRTLRNQTAHAVTFSPRLDKVQTYIRQSLLLSILAAATWNAE